MPADAVEPPARPGRWRKLFGALRHADSEQTGWDAVDRWITGNGEALQELRLIGDPDLHGRPLGWHPGSHALRGSTSHLGELYALSRVLDVLIAAQSSGPIDPTTADRSALHLLPLVPPPASMLETLAAWAGWVSIAEDRFHPFFHEIVQVVLDDDPDALPQLVGQVWPGFLVGSLLLARSGVVVRSGRNHLEPVVASSSPMYWAWWRRTRPAVDLSHGWGSNSQWRTEFRRDYVVGDELHLNVDAQWRRSSVRPEDPAILVELVRYRSGSTVDLGGDQWPFDTYVVERRDTGVIASNVPTGSG